jgi:hypothetical protein
MNKLIFISLTSLFTFCTKHLLDFNTISSKDIDLLKGNYYCESPEKSIIGKQFGFIEFNDEYDVDVGIVYECKGLYLRFFKEHIVLSKDGNDIIKYRGKYCDLLLKNNSLYLFVNYQYTQSIYELKREPSSDSLFTFIKNNVRDH